MQFSLGEFFCGPGGIALGAVQAGTVNAESGDLFSISPKWATDYDYDTCCTYSQNIHKLTFENNPHVIFNDVRKLTIEELDPCDGFAFGFPCNDFSIVGETKGLDGEFGPLFSYGVEYLKRHKPQWFLAENVGGLSSSNEGRAFNIILKELANAGYRIVPHLYKFEKYGVPQARHRIIIVGIRDDLDVEFKVPAPLGAYAIRTSRQAIETPEISDNAYNHEKTNQSETVVKRLSYIKPGENAWSQSIPEELRLNVKGAKLSNIYKRLDPTRPAYTVTGSGGGGTHMYHWSESRALTNRERARLQTFPDDFIFYGKKESVRKQIGMAVPPDGIRHIFKAILNTFANVRYETTESNISTNIERY